MIRLTGSSTKEITAQILGQVPQLHSDMNQGTPPSFFLSVVFVRVPQKQIQRGTLEADDSLGR